MKNLKFQKTFSLCSMLLVSLISASRVLAQTDASPASPVDSNKIIASFTAKKQNLGGRSIHIRSSATHLFKALVWVGK
jgi:hypothetical protein